MEHVGELISGRLLSIGPSARLAEAAGVLARERVSHLLVIREHELLGILCACDVERATLDASVAEAMSRRRTRRWRRCTSTA